MPFRFGSLLNYSAKGSTKKAKTSVTIKDSIKNGERNNIKKIIDVLTEDKYLTYFKDFLNEDTLLIPVPSSRKYRANSLWNTQILCDSLVKANLGHSVAPLVKRQTSVSRSSHFANSKDRVFPKAHIKSMTVSGIIPRGVTNITIVDDILTLGRTSYSTAKLLLDFFTTEELNIRVFCFMRNQGLESNKELTRIVQPRIGTISYNPHTDKTTVR
ncbi:hypothetical protein [Marivirga sericea]|uniref:hypothetical protein n=1 Tax=Marivirga sericea TaxID=1028 RepID=UPI00111C24AC|nr:hypothetical protein [Marivirga sericea]